MLDQSGTSSQRSPLRWLVVPGLLALFALAGMAVSSSERQTSTSPQPDSPAEAIQIDPDSSDSGSDSNPIEGVGNSSEITVTSPNGEVTVDFDDNGVARVRPSGDATQDNLDRPEVELTPGGDSYEISADGQLSPVPTANGNENDLDSDRGVTLGPDQDSGITVVNPNGDGVGLRPNPETGGVTAVDLGDGTDPFTLNDDGFLELDDGTTIGPLEELVPQVVEFVDPQSMPWRIIFTVIAVVAAVSAITGIVLHRKSEELPVVMGQAPGSVMRTVPFADLIERLATDPDPTRAIRVGFDAAQAGLGGIPTRSADETPFEWHARVAKVRPEVAGPVQILCDLFARARFAPGEATEQDRQATIEQLETIHHSSGTTTGSWALETADG